MLTDFHYTIEEKDLDLYGHVNNARYVEIYELARWHHYECFNIFKKDILESQTGPIVLDLSIKYRKELHLNEKICIKSYFSEFKRPIDKIQQVLFNSKNEIASTAILSCAYFDLQKRKIISIPEEYKKIHQTMLKLQGDPLSL